MEYETAAIIIAVISTKETKLIDYGAVWVSVISSERDRRIYGGQIFKVILY